MCNPAPERLPGQAAALRKRLAAPELRELRDVVLLWGQQAAKRYIGTDMGIFDMAEEYSYFESEGLDEYFAERRREYEETYRDEGRAEGLAAERNLLRGQTERKFGARAGERVAPLLEGVGDAEVMAVVGGWIIDCATGDELIARLGSLQ